MKLMICALMFIISTSAFATRLLLSNDSNLYMSITEIHTTADGNTGRRETNLTQGMSVWSQAPDNLVKTNFEVLVHLNGQIIGRSIVPYNWIEQNPNAETMNFRFYLRGENVHLYVTPVR